jgi:proteasome beta subunit
MEENQQRKGTTTVGIVCKDAVVMAADKRATMGYLIANKNVEKIFKITNNIALTIAGYASDGQVLARLLRAEMDLYRYNTGVEPSLTAASNLLATIVFERAKSYMPYVVQLIMGGIDENNEYALYTIDMGGSIIKEDMYYSTGSGSPMAFGVLEDSYKENMTTEQGAELAIKALASALKRDAGTGEGVEVIIIDKKGYRKLEKEKVNAVLKPKLG